MASLFIVATPIGNLHDVSLRALETLKGVDLILAEDTRQTKKLLGHYQIKTPLISYHQHSKLRKLDYILGLLKEGKDLALVSDAGTPGVSDPGNKLIAKVVEKLDEEVRVIPVPGASALIAAASISGFSMDSFVFLGFPPVKKKRKRFFEEMVNYKHPVIFYESPYRIIKTLQELSQTKPGLVVVVCRELTKKFETVYRGNVEKVMKEIEKDKVKGEFVVVVKSKS